MPALAIDSMQFDVPGLSEPQARDLAHLVAIGLAGATGLPDAASIPAIRLDLTHGAPATGAPDVPGLARQIVAATLRAIAHAAAGIP
jgi:hypothetical protein